MKYLKKFAIICAMFTFGTAYAVDLTKCVGSITTVMSDGKSVTFWGYGTVGTTMGGGCPATVPAAPIDVIVGDTLNLKLNINGMTPQEVSPYNGHTIHLHGADVDTRNDGVPDTNFLVRKDTFVNGDSYSFTPTKEMYGSYMYHCHVHTVKHLEMGMYGPLIVRPQDPNKAGAYLNQINESIDTAYAYEMTYLFSTVDPAYHNTDLTKNLDNPVFADYNPVYFLINGVESKTKAAVPAAATLVAMKSQKVALRLIGLHSVNGTFEIKDESGTPQPFTIYVEDGRTYSKSEPTNSLDIAPAQRFDIIFTTPNSTGTLYPQITYKKLRVDPTNPASAIYATAYGKVTF